MSVPAERGIPELRAVAPHGAFRLTLPLAVLTCALAPAYVIRWRVGPFPTTALEAGILLTIAVFAWESLRQRQRPEWRSPFTIFGALLLVAGAISVVVAPDRRAALGLYRAYFIEPAAFFVVLATVIRTSQQAFAVFAGLAAGGTVVALLNIATVLDALRHHAVDTSANAPVAIYQTSNAVALFLIPIMAIAGSLVLHSPHPDPPPQAGEGDVPPTRPSPVDGGVNVTWRRRIALVFLAVAGVAVLLSFSRGGYVALLVLGIGLAISSRWRWWLLGGIAVFVVIATRVPIIASRLGHEINMNDPTNTLAGRIHLWRVTLHMMREHLLFGTGLSGYAHYMSPWPNGLIQEIYPHNLLLNFWVITGVLGLVAFLGLLVQAFRTSWRGWRKLDNAWRPFELGVLLAMVTLVVHGLVDVPYFKNDLSFEFWVLLGISWAGFAGSTTVAQRDARSP